MKNLNEELNRIGSLMGLKPKLLNEQAQLPRTIIKKVLGGEEPMEAVRKIFNLSDNEASNLATRLERGGVESLGDDFIESLASRTIDDMSQLTSLLKQGGYLADIDVLSLNILNNTKINNLTKITSENYEKIVDTYRKSLDEVAWLKNFPDLKNQLVDDFEMSFTEKFQSKIAAGSDSNVTQKIDNIIDDMVDDDIRNISETLMTDDEIMKAFKSENEWWNNAFFRIFVDRRREATRALQSYKIDDATKSVLKGKTKEEIRAIVKQEIKESLEGNKELMKIIKDKSFVGRWSRLSGKAKTSIILTLGLGGAPLLILLFGVGSLLRENASEFLVWLNDWFDNWRKNLETERLGLLTKLEQGEEEIILKTIRDYDETLPTDMFDEHGNLVSEKYMINYSENENSIEILDINNNYKPVKEYNIDQINKLIRDNQ